MAVFLPVMASPIGLPDPSSATALTDWAPAMLRSVTAPVIRRCPFQIGIVSTGLIVQGTAESRVLLECRVGTLVLDEAHRARRSRGITASGDANRLMEFMLRAAPKARQSFLAPPHRSRLTSRNLGPARDTQQRHRPCARQVRQLLAASTNCRPGPHRRKGDCR